MPFLFGVIFMHIPSDKPLDQWIRELIADGNLYKFYKTREWLELRQAIMDEQHNECEICREAGIYSRADTVHHVNEVKDRPELALSRTYIDGKGQRKRNLMALCFACHNKVHGRFQGGWWRKKEKPLTEERWD